MKKIYRLLLVLICLFPLAHTAFSQNAKEVLVNNRGGHAIQRYDENGNYLGDFIAPSSGGLVNPEDIIFHPNGTVLVSGFGNTTIKSYDGLTGVYIGDFSSGYNLSSPSKMSIGPDSLIYITQWGASQNKVVRFDLSGNFVDEFTSVGAPNGMGHLWDEEGNFYVALFGSNGNGTVHKFDSAGNDLGTFINSTVLQGPTDIWWHGDGDMLVQDWSVGVVRRYDSTGAYLGTFAVGLTNPEGIDSLPNGDLLMGDWGQDGVYRVSPTGTVLGFFASGNGLIDPNGLKVIDALSVGGVSEPENKRFVYPSSGDRFYIALPEGIDPQLKLEVMSLEGKRVAELNLVSTIWDATHLKSGVYFVVLRNQDEMVQQKILVMH